jgi:DNA-directed RNA polymerase beta subunit
MGENLFSIQLRLLPWVNTTDTTRLQMASKYAGGQALPHENQDIPYCIPDSIFDVVNVFNTGEYLKFADYDGRVLCADDEILMVEYDTNDPNERIKIYEIPPFKQLTSKFATRLRYRIPEGAEFSKNDLLFEYTGFKEGLPTIGYQAKVMFGSFHNINHEDAVIISESFAKRLSHYFRQTYIIPVYSKFKLFKNSHDKLLPEIGEYYKYDEVIIAYNEQYEDPIGQNRNASVLELIQKFTNDRVKANLKQIAAEVDNIKVENIEVYKITTNRRTHSPFLYDPKTEDILSEYSKVTEKRIQDKIDRIREKIDDDLIVKNIISEYLKLNNITHTSSIQTISDLHYVIKLELVSEQNFKEGDKVSTIAGGKGVSAYVIPDDLMPKTKDGETIDLIISIFTVPSRMNMNQIYEFFTAKLIYLANRMLFGKFQFPPEVKSKYSQEFLQYKLPIQILLDIAKLFTHKYNEQQIKLLEEYLNDTEKLKREIIDTGDEIRLIVDHFKDPNSYTIDDIINIYKKYEEFSIKVIDEIEIPNAKAICKKLTNNSDICDELLSDKNNNVTIHGSWGILTILNLYKVGRYNWNARAIGRYKRISKQPTRGKKLQGGSRLGNDEISMLLSYDTEYLLKEFAYIKSDDHVNKIHFLSQYPIKGNFSLKTDLKEKLSSYTLEVIENLLNTCFVTVVKDKSDD